MTQTSARASIRQAVGPAMIAGSLSVVAALTLRYVFSIPSPAEGFAEEATTRIPLALFEFLLTTFGPLAKHLYLVSALVVEAGLSALAGLGYLWIRQVVLRRIGRSASAAELTWLDAPVIAVGLWLLSAGALAPILGGGVLGSELLGGIPATAISQATPDIVFAVSFVWQTRAAIAMSSAQVAGGAGGALTSRRALLQQGAAAVGLLGFSIALWETLTSGFGAALGVGPATGTRALPSLGDVPDRIIPPPVPAYTTWPPIAGQTADVTPASQFYYVSKNLAADPALSTSAWKLSVSGMVNSPYRLTYSQLQALPRVTQYHTLECISNEVGGNLMSNGLFVGTHLSDILNAAGIQPGATQMTFTAADGYSDSLHLAQALDERSLVVYLLDGAPLAQAHGYPARLLIPGLYGMKNGKWLTGLNLGAGSYTGYWEQRGWTSVAAVKLMSRIDTPRDSDLLVGGSVSIAGVAYGGAEGIGRVDVSVDGGRTWTPANLRRPAGALSWTLWEYPWQTTPGQHLIVARAIDLAGRVQTPRSAPPLPDGSSGYHAIAVSVR
jgi:DMSO/TMAO reductase YedYZ molybdopterin-dependent catalytic subunit